ncbi:hypothetical protein GE09DRAFT_788638 [Coniochaeta sp. 2T2.1]|nr:hypothetical protein GE09DRAFT_788638 [Coniochaeta sp. 2T2.1]
MMIIVYSPLLAALVGLAAAIPAAYEAREFPCEPHVKCVDRINTCGVRFGGCYDTCHPSLEPVDPGCGAEEAAAATPSTICVTSTDICHQTYGGCFPATVSPYPTFTPPKCPLTSGPPVRPTSTRPVTQICEYTQDRCSQTYGGCYAPTDGRPTFTTPSCSLEITPAAMTTVAPPAVTPTICVDYVNKCGQMYGGCFASTRPFPTFTGPSCSLETTPPPVVTTVAPPSTTVTPTICVDYVNKCGQTYGGCFASTRPFPTFTGPSCSLETTPPPVTTVAPPVTTAVPTICVDTINACGKTYGGCFASTSPFPTFTDPGCP